MLCARNWLRRTTPCTGPLPPPMPLPLMPLPQPTTPLTSRRTRPAKDSFETAGSSSPHPTTGVIGKKTPGGANEDLLLHRVLDKNWCSQATPLGKPPLSQHRTTRAAPEATPKDQIQPPPGSESPMSSPPKPNFHSADIFSSPTPGFSGFGGGKKPKPSTTSNTNTTTLARGPKTPTSRRYGTAKVTTTHHHEPGRQEDDEDIFAYDYDDDDFDDWDLPPGLSPPITIQFSLPP